MAFIYELQSESHLQVFGFIGIGGSLKFVLPGTRDIGGGPIHTRAKSVGVIDPNFFKKVISSLVYKTF